MFTEGDLDTGRRGYYPTSVIVTRPTVSFYLVKVPSMRAIRSNTEKCSNKGLGHNNGLIRLHTTTPLTYNFAFCNPSVSHSKHTICICASELEVPNPMMQREPKVGWIHR